MMEKRDRPGGGGQRRQQRPWSKTSKGNNPEKGGIVNDNEIRGNDGNNNNVGGGMSGSKKAADPRTLFVKFHPPSAYVTRQHLSDHFSNYGPVNRCSVIRRTKSGTPSSSSSSSGDAADVDDGDGGGGGGGGGDRGSRGFGFVRFVNEEDARAAADAIREKARRAKRGGGGEEVMVVDGARYVIRAELAADAAVVVGRGAAAAPPEDDKDDADARYRAETKRKRTSRVIVRNLSFHATEKHVRSVMESRFGPVASIDLPLVPGSGRADDDDDDGGGGGGGGRKKGRRSADPAPIPRHRGFAFVTFVNAADARRAVGDGADVVEEVMIKNRPVAIDFSVSKMEHRRIAKEGVDKKEEEEEEEEEEESESKSVDEEEKEEEDGEDDDDDEGDSEDDDGSDSGSEAAGDDSDEGEEEGAIEAKDVVGAAPARDHDPSEARRTLFLRNVPFDASRHDVFELFRKFGRVEAAYLVKERETGAFKGTAFVRFETEGACESAMASSRVGGGDDDGGGGGGGAQFVSGKNIAMGLGAEGGGMGGDPSSGLTLKGRTILVDLAVDRTTASSLAVRRDDDGKPIKKMVGKDKRNLYLKNEGRVSSAAESGDAREASAKHGGMWEDLPPGDRAKRERAFADKSTKLRSPLFFINPHRISIRNLAKHIDEAALKRMVFGALRTGLKEGMVSPKDAVAHWRAGGELAHSEVMRRATDPNLVTPPLDEKNMKGSVTSVFIDRDVSGGKKAADAPSRGFGFVEFAHHTHALAVLRQLNNNPAYSAEYTAGGKHASEMVKQKRGKKGKKAKVDPETGLEFLSEDGKVSVPRLIVEFAVENKVKARQQADKVAQKKANKIKQKIENKEKQPPSIEKKKDKEKRLGRGALQREKKRARKEAGEDGDAQTKESDASSSKMQKLDDKVEKPKEKKLKMVKPQKKRKIDKDDDALEDMIRSYKSTFSKGGALVDKETLAEESSTAESKAKSRESIVKKRWFE